MSDEATTEAAETAAPEAPKPTAPDAVETWKGHARTWEARAKANADKADKLEAQLASVKETTEAELRGTLAVEFGTKLATSEIRHAASRKAIDPDALLENLKVDKFVKDDGSVDTETLNAWLDKVAPNVDTLNPDFGNGDRDEKQPQNKLPDGLTKALKASGLFD